MKKLFPILFSVVILVTLIASFMVIPTSAVDNTIVATYLRIDGIDGASKDSNHNQWIEVVDFHHASVQSVQTGSPDAAGRGIFEPVVFKHIVDKATPRLQEACMKGSFIKSAELQCCRAIAGKQEVAYKVKYEGVKIIKAEVAFEKNEEGKCVLVETVSFLCNKQTWTTLSSGLDNSIGGSTEADYDQSKKATMLDDGATLTTVIVGAVAFFLAVVLVVVLIKRKQQSAKAVPAGDAGVGDESDT